MLPGPSVSILSRSPRSPHSPTGGPLSAGLTDPSPPPGKLPDSLYRCNVFTGQRIIFWDTR